MLQKWEQTTPKLTLAGMLELSGGGPNPSPAAAAFSIARRWARSFLCSSSDFKAVSCSHGNAWTSSTT